MKIVRTARWGLVALSLMAASCTTTTPPPAGSDDNGANCGGTAANKENCINNQNRMGTGGAAP